MEEQYRDYFGKPITKKQYEEKMKRRKKANEKLKKEEKEYYSKFFHDDGSTPIQGLVDEMKKDDDIEATKQSRILKYKKGEYIGKIRELNPSANVTKDSTMKELMEELNKAQEKKKQKEKKETKKFGRPKKKGELEASKGAFIKKKRTGFTDYRVKGLFS